MVACRVRARRRYRWYDLEAAAFLGREPINLQGVRLARVRYCPDSDQNPQRSELSRWANNRPKSG